MKGSAMKGLLGNRRTAARWVLSLAAAAAFVAAAPQARAVIITHSTAGVLISDGFEGPTDTVGSFPVGWTIANRVGGSVTTASVDVENAGSHLGNPAANEGLNYLAVHTDDDGAYQTFGPYAHGTITAEFAFYLPDSSFSSISPTFLKAAGLGITPAAEYVQFDAYGYTNSIEGTTLGSGLGALDYYNGGGYALLTVDGGNPYNFTLGAWHKVTMTDNIDDGTSASALTITIDGITLDPLPSTNALAGSVDGFQVYENTNGTGFVDTIVPEPASLTLLCGGVVMLLSRRRA